VQHATTMIVEKISKLREMSPLYEMVKQGIDLKTVQWSSH